MDEGIKKPIKRSKELTPLSREHHDGLLLCWKIKNGLSNNIPVERIVAYTVYFYNSFLKPHFAEEEKYVFTLLSDDDAMIAEATAQHNILNGMIATLDSVQDKVEWLKTFAYELDRHIRYEERQLFNYIEDRADKAALAYAGAKLAEPHNAHIKDEWTDIFWTNKN
jgi:hemerythrin-like domain-containing protein